LTGTLTESLAESLTETVSQPSPRAGQLRPAAFLDRDGTICEEMGYLNHISRLHIFPFAAQAIRRLNEAHMPVIVVTNQSGISRGIFPESLVAEVHRRITGELARSGARVDAYYFCSHTRADDCQCRKPLPGLLLQAAREHALDLTRSYVVGDRYADVELAHAAGGKGLLVLTGYGRGEVELNSAGWLRQTDAVVEDLTEAVDFMLRSFQSAGGNGAHA
jgi:D-glycero-D-manno-heptose 1,7-bisphosphate phosphatase